MFEQDYIKRLCESIGNMIVAFVAGKDAVTSKIEDENHDVKLSQDDLLEIMIKKYLYEDKINEAEDLIFDSMHERHSKKVYEIALDFYKQLNQYSDEKLNNCDFSREEIKDGLEELKALLN